MAIQYGISINDFYEYSLKEVTTIIKAKVDKEKIELKKEAFLAYNHAAMIRSFINSSEIPSIYDCFPTIFVEESEEAEANKEYNEMLIQKQRLIDFANNYNNRKRCKENG